MPRPTQKESTHADRLLKTLNEVDGTLQRLQACRTKLIKQLARVGAPGAKLSHGMWVN